MPPLLLSAKVSNMLKVTLDFLIPKNTRGIKKSNGTYAEQPPRTPDERQPDTGTIVILVANGRTEVAKLMLQSKKHLKGACQLLP